MEDIEIDRLGKEFFGFLGLYLLLYVLWKPYNTVTLFYCNILRKSM
jgi:hypothetical protein